MNKLDQEENRKYKVNKESSNVRINSLGKKMDATS